LFTTIGGVFWENEYVFATNWSAKIGVFGKIGVYIKKNTTKSVVS
jgi:hypothetical protein